MSYFNRFPLLAYAANNNAVVNIVSDVLRRVTVDKKTKENLVIFDEYDIQDGETPELVSYKFYDTTDYHWVILIVNDILDPRFGWPLTDEQLYTYTANKYGTANVNATKHYVAFEGSDIVVDPTQNVITKTVEIVYNFPDNVDSLFEYAANGIIDLSLTESQRAFINYLQQPTDENLPGTGTLLRGDIDHSYISFPPGTPTNQIITSTDALDAFQIAANIPFESDPDGPGPLQPESMTQAFVFNYIKPAVDQVEDVNSPLYNNMSYLSNLSIQKIAVGSPFINQYKGPVTGNVYRITSGVASGLLAAAIGNPLNPDFGQYIFQVIQTKHLRGDLNRSGKFSGTRNGSSGTDRSLNDANIALQFQRGIITEASPYYDTIYNLLTEMSANTQIQPILGAPLSAIYGQETSLAYPNAYEVTNIAHESEINETKRRIRVLKNEYISAFVTEFERLVNG